MVVTADVVSVPVLTKCCPRVGAAISQDTAAYRLAVLDVIAAAGFGMAVVRPVVLVP